MLELSSHIIRIEEIEENEDQGESVEENEEIPSYISQKEDMD